MNLRYYFIKKLIYINIIKMSEEDNFGSQIFCWTGTTLATYFLYHQ